MKKEETSKIVLERTYNIPLRREALKVPPFRKANKAVKTVQEFLSKHMKSDNVVIGKYLNLKIWKRGARNPPHHIKVNVSKDNKNRVFAEFADAPKEKSGEQIKDEKKIRGAKKEEKESKAEEKRKPEENLEKEIEGIKEEKAEEAKKIEKEEIRELKQEHQKHHPQKVPPKQRLQDMHPPAPKSL